MNKNHWFLLRNIATFNGKPFSCLTSSNQCFIKYNLLDFNFDLSSDLIWFTYSWRRREGEEISYLRATKKITLTLEEILDTPYFRKLNLTDGEKIEKEIQNNDKIKQAMIERYAKQLGSQLYDQAPERVSYVLYERYCGYKDILNRLKELHMDDDFSKVEDISECVLISY